MTDQKHTPEPWRIGWDSEDECCFAVTDYPGAKLIAGDIEREEDARRIVAVVNACEGISTEALENGVVKELLEALEALQVVFPFIGKEFSRSISPDDKAEVMEYALNAIAKATEEP